VAAARPATEREALDFLSLHGVPVVPATVTHSAAEAVAAACALDGPVVLKIHSPDIAHKSDIGGVALGLRGDDAVSAAWTEMMARCAEAAPQARLDGIIVSPMRGKGTELFVGVARDPVWGPVLAVGLGGVWVEALQDTRLLLLPAGRDEITEAFRSLRAARLLDGYRGALPVDLDAVADAVARIGEAALALGPDLAALEVNPLLAGPDGVEALDALPVWETPG
jgi:succinyl-CoA synthetase beta subunit